MIFVVDFEAHALEISSYARKARFFVFEWKCAQKCQKTAKMVKKPLSVKLCKPIAPFERSGSKIFVVDSEAHTYEISSYALKSKRFYVLGRKYAQNTKKGPKSCH